MKPLAPSLAWTLVTPYCKRTRPGRGTNTKAAGFPPLSRPSPATSLPHFALGLAPTHLGWGTRRHSLVGLGTPRSRNAEKYVHGHYNKVVGAFLILLVLKFHNHRPDSLGVMNFANRLLCFVHRQNRFRKLNCLIQFNIESILGDYKGYVVLLLSFPKSLRSLFFGGLKLKL